MITAKVRSSAKPIPYSDRIFRLIGPGCPDPVHGRLSHIKRSSGGNAPEYLVTHWSLLTVYYTNTSLNLYHPSTDPDFPEFGDLGIAGETSSDDAEPGFEERA